MSYGHDNGGEWVARDIIPGCVIRGKPGETLLVTGVQNIGAAVILDFSDGTATIPLPPLQPVAVIRAPVGIG